MARVAIGIGLVFLALMGAFVAWALATGKRSSLQALGSIYGAGIRAVFRRARKPAFGADSAARRDELAKLAVRVGSGVGRSRVRSIFAGRAKRATIRDAAALKASQDVVETMGQMKGLMMKLGQFASFLAPLPDAAEAELIQLQSAAPPMDFDKILGVIRADFGDDAEAQFGSIDPTPIASASIGQVHRATLPDGREVVVKVQYPGIEETVRADLDALDQLLAVYSMGTTVDLSEFMSDFEDMLRSELDYVAEAENQAYFARRYAGHPAVKIAEIVPELCAGRVLTSEYVRGRTLYEVVSEDQETRNRLGETIYRFAYDSVFSGVFSGDPHPGNYLFLDDGRVCFLDFGFLQRFDDPEHEIPMVKAPALAALAGDREALGDALRALGLTPDKGRSDTDKLWQEVGPILYGPLDRDEVTTFGPEWLKAATAPASKMTSELSKLRKSTTTKSWITIVMRYGIGTMAVLSKLGAELNCRALASELLASDPTRTVPRGSEG